MIWLKTAITTASVAVVLSSCGDSSPQANKGTHWLTHCEETSECGQYECVCGTCTLHCGSDDECTGGVDARCSSTTVVAADDLCVPGASEAMVCWPVDGDGTSDAAKTDGGRDGAVPQASEPWTYIKASNTDADDQFGDAVAMDGNTLVVGAPSEGGSATGVGGDQGDNSLTNTGAAYVFTLENGAWRQQAYLKASNTHEGALFGNSVDIDGDRLVVGAYGEGTGGAEESGAVYVFNRSSGSWVQEAYLKASNADGGDAFGWSVALSGDTLAVGASGEQSSARGVGADQGDNGAPGAGAVYVFRRASDGWVQEAYIKTSTASTQDWFGFSVDISADTLVASATVEQDRGAVYIFERAGGQWTEHTRLAGAAAGSVMGRDIALEGDRLVIGDQGHDVGAPSDRGAVYVFDRIAGVWQQQALLTVGGQERHGEEWQWGWSVALSGDMLAAGMATGATAPESVYVFELSEGGWTQTARVQADPATPEPAFGFGFGDSVALSGGLLAIGVRDDRSSATGIDGDLTDISAQNAGAVFVMAP